MGKNNIKRWQKYTDEGYRNPEYDKFVGKLKLAILLILLLFLILLIFYKEIANII